jgi:hypothetical protein
MNFSLENLARLQTIAFHLRRQQYHLSYFRENGGVEIPRVKTLFNAQVTYIAAMVQSNSIIQLGKRSHGTPQ